MPDMLRSRLGMQALSSLAGAGHTLERIALLCEWAALRNVAEREGIMAPEQEFRLTEIERKLWPPPPSR